MSTPPPTGERTGEAVPLDVGEMLRMLWRRRWLLIAPWITAIIAAGAAAVLLPPVYVSRAMLVLDRGQSLQGPTGQLSGGSGLDQQAEIMKEQVQSGTFLRAVIGATGVARDASARSWARRAASKYPGANEDEQFEMFMSDHLREQVAIKRSKGQLFEIQVSDLDADRARLFADAIANQIVESSKARQMEQIRAGQEFSSEQALIYKRRLEEAEARLRSAESAAISSSVVGTAVSDRNVTFAQTLADQASIEADELRQRLQDLRAQAAGRLRDNDPALLTGGEISGLIAQLSSLEGQMGRAQLSEGSYAGGSSVRMLLARRSAELELALGEAAARALPGLAPDARDLAVRIRLAQANLGAKENWRSWVQGQIVAYQRQVVSSPGRLMEIERLRADVESARQIYNAFTSQSASMTIQEAFQNAKLSGRFVVQNPASRPLSPSKPNRAVLVLLGVVLGGILGIGTVLVAEHNDPSMKNAAEVETLLGLPVLGAIPRVDELDRSKQRRSRGPSSGPAVLPAPRDQGLLHRLKVESPLGLEFKRIYLNLARARDRQMPHTLMITSSTRGEGKTTTSACLGITLAREHRARTLLVDFDLRSPALHRALGMPSSSWGVAQMLQQRHFDERFIRQTSLPTLDFLAAGRSERAAAELIDQEAVTWFLAEARQRYDLVVLDTAPNLAVPDPLIIGRAVEGVLYVVKAGQTVRKAAEYGVKVQREAMDNLLGVLMNDAGEFLPQYYGYKQQYYGYTSEAVEG